MPFYILDPSFLATVSLAPSCYLAVYPNQEDCGLVLKVLALLVENRYAEAMEAVNSCATLSASVPKLISVLGDIKLEARFWNCSHSVNFSSGSKS
jgi:hypothetical protein